MEKLREIVFSSDTRAGYLFDITVQVLIVLSLVAFSIETLPGLSPETYKFLTYFEIVIVALFSIEYVLRVTVAEKRLSYIFSFYGIIDLLAILPFYLSASLSLQTLRVLRLLRLFRILKLTRYSSAFGRIGKSIYLAKEEFILFSLVSLIILYLSAVGIYHFEHTAQPESFRSIFDSLWWAVATLTTVGYGDIYPVTAGGKFFTFIVLMLGLGSVAVPTGILASSLAVVRKDENKDKQNHDV